MTIEGAKETTGERPDILKMIEEVLEDGKAVHEALKAFESSADSTSIPAEVLTENRRMIDAYVKKPSYPRIFNGPISEKSLPNRGVFENRKFSSAGPVVSIPDEGTVGVAEQKAILDLADALEKKGVSAHEAREIAEATYRLQEAPQAAGLDLGPEAVETWARELGDSFLAAAETVLPGPIGEPSRFDAKPLENQLTAFAKEEGLPPESLFRISGNEADVLVRNQQQLVLLRLKLNVGWSPYDTATFKLPSGEIHLRFEIGDRWPQFSMESLPEGRQAEVADWLEAKGLRLDRLTFSQQEGLVRHLGQPSSENASKKDWDQRELKQLTQGYETMWHLLNAFTTAKSESAAEPQPANAPEPTRQGKLSPAGHFGARALSIGGLLTFSPEMLKVGLAATAASLLGRILFSDPVKPSAFRRFLHLFSTDLAVKHWSDKAQELREQGKNQEAKKAYEKAIDIAARRTGSERPVSEDLNRLADLQQDYGFLLRRLQDLEGAVSAQQKALGTSRNAARLAATPSEKHLANLNASTSRLAIYSDSVEAAHQAARRGDALTAARYYETAADAVPLREDLTSPRNEFWNPENQRNWAFARAWQYYVKAGGQEKAIEGLIKKATASGLNVTKLRQMSIRLAAELSSKG
jgi:tetratricopeptide repeat protein